MQIALKFLPNSILDKQLFNQWSKKVNVDRQTSINITRSNIYCISVVRIYLIAFPSNCRMYAQVFFLYRHFVGNFFYNTVGLLAT